MEAQTETIVPTKPPKATKPSKAIVLTDQPPMSPESRALELAIQQGAPLEQLEKFMALKRAHEADEARKAFNRAFADFKAEAVVITKGTEIKDGPLKGKFHANLHDVVSATTPALSKHGLTIAWKLTKDDSAWMEVTCTLRHDQGHSESVSMGGAPDTGPGRNAIQARGSTKSYLERYTATAILGLAAADADDDGAGGARVTVGMTEEHAATITALCEEVGKDTRGRVLLSYKAKAFADIPDSEYDSIVRRLNATKGAK